jgi:hypothetical protein
VDNYRSSGLREFEVPATLPGTHPKAPPREVRRVLGERAFERACGAPARARHWLLRLLREYQLPNTVWDDATLITSELVSNAYLHTRSERISVTVSRWSGLHIEVRDDADCGPLGEAAPDLMAESGHGLQLVQAMAIRWGQSSCERGGKAVWAVLALPSAQ